MSTELRNFLAIPYDELEELNLKAKKQRLDRVTPHKIQEERLKYLTDEKRIKALDRAVQRPRRPSAHAGLRQEIPAEELRQPDVLTVRRSAASRRSGKK